MKPIVLLGSSLEDLRAFPASGRRMAGHQLDRVQQGLEPDDWKPIPAIGQGVPEVRVREPAGAFRIIYTANLPGAVYILHAFQKKTQRTAKRDLDLTEARHTNLMRSIR